MKITGLHIFRQAISRAAKKFVRILTPQLRDKVRENIDKAAKKIWTFPLFAEAKLLSAKGWARLSKKEKEKLKKAGITEEMIKLGLIPERLKEEQAKKAFGSPGELKKSVKTRTVYEKTQAKGEVYSTHRKMELIEEGGLVKVPKTGVGTTGRGEPVRRFPAKRIFEQAINNIAKQAPETLENILKRELEGKTFKIVVVI